MEEGARTKVTMTEYYSAIWVRSSRMKTCPNWQGHVVGHKREIQAVVTQEVMWPSYLQQFYNM
jgi:hypothetical protein